MHNIQIKIQAFGAIERLLPTDLMIMCMTSTSISDVLEKVEQQYPDAQKMIERCACAIGEDIVPRKMLLNNDTTLVLLSPVAGG